MHPAFAVSGPAVLVVSLVLAGCGGGDRRDAEPVKAPARTGAASTSRPAGQPAVVVSRDNPCSVLLPSEVSEILGVTISMREVVDETTCHFVYDAPEEGAPPFLAIRVHFTDGPAVVTATRMAGKLLGGDAGFERVPDIGDEAWLGPLASLLVFRKGDVGVELDLRMVPDGRDKGIRLARLIAQRL